MSELKLKVGKREQLGKAAAGLRKLGTIPGVVYGQGKPATPIAVSERDLERAYNQAGTSKLVELDIAGEAAKNVLFHEVQHDPLTHKILHFDLYSVRMDQEITTEVPLHFIGDSEAVHQFQAVLVKTLETVEIEALPKDLPEHIEVDIGKLAELEDALFVKDLPVPVGVKILNEPEEMVVKAEAPQETTEADIEAEKAADEAAAAAAEAEVEAEHGGAEVEGEEEAGEGGEETAESPAAEAAAAEKE